MPGSMGINIFFKWEDSPALKHHCGVCDRPLSHPTAISTCFGTHSEPCHRFHQQLFMRNRGHCCKTCGVVEEAHYQRHFDIAERLRAIYERCGEDWPIIPEDVPERGRARDREPDSVDEEDRSSISGGTQHASKKQRKQLKSLNRAASRQRFITQEEIKYLEFVLHTDDTNNEAESPRNPAEVEEIEKNLRYNAQIYNTGQKRKVLRELARIADAEIDFEAEIDRILDALRITELLKSNIKNRGLRGKDLKAFHNLVSEFKERVVEDLLLLKKDEMEVRMRRAAYLRYTNRAAFYIVEERYAVKDWRTGEKFPTAVGTASSDSRDLIEEEQEVLEEENRDKDVGASPTQAPVAPANAPDRRHLVRSHKRVGSNGSLEEVDNLRRSPNRSPKKPQGISKKQPRQIRLVTHSNENTGYEQSILDSPKESHKLYVRSPDRHDRRSRLRSPTTDRSKPSIFDVDSDGWQRVPRASKISQKYPALPLAPVSSTILPRGSVLARGIDEQPTEIMDGREQNSSTVVDFQHFDQDKQYAPAPVGKMKMATSTGTWEEEDAGPKASLSVASPTISPLQPEQSTQSNALSTTYKKLKKKKREAERKARRAAAEEHSKTLASELDAEEQPRIPELKEKNLVNAGLNDHFNSKTLSRLQEETSPALPAPSHRHTTVGEDTNVTRKSTLVENRPSYDDNLDCTRQPQPLSASKCKKADLEEKQKQKPPTEATMLEELGSLLSPAQTAVCKHYQSAQLESPPIRKTGRHTDWSKFTSYFKVDRFSTPAYIASNDCMADEYYCPFESNGVPDCPFHNPHCDCADPFRNPCVLVYPADEPLVTPPYNRIRAQKLLSYFESQPRTNEKVILVDDSIIGWLRKDGRHFKPGDIPPHNMPHRLLQEYEVFMKKADTPGPLLFQMILYQWTADRNETLLRPVTRMELQRMQLQFDGTACRTHRICYCEVAMPEYWSEKDIVECSYRGCRYRLFHRSCVKNLGVEKVSRWYCTECERLMAKEAQITLEEVDCLRAQMPLLDPNLDLDYETFVKELEALKGEFGDFVLDGEPLPEYKEVIGGCSWR